MANDNNELQDDMFDQDEGFFEDQFLSQLQDEDDSSDSMDYLNEFFQNENEEAVTEDNQLEDFVSGMDLFPQDDEIPEMNDFFGIDDAMTQEETQQVDDDFMSLLSQLNPEDPVTEDIHAINDLLNGKAPEPIKKESTPPSDVGEVFSEALKAVNSLDDLADLESIVDIENLVPETKEEEKKKSKKEKKIRLKKEKAALEEKDNSSDAIEKKESLFHKIFKRKVKDQKNEAISSESNISSENEEKSAKKSAEKVKPSKKQKAKSKPAKKAKSKPTAVNKESSEDGENPKSVKAKKQAKAKKDPKAKKAKKVKVPKKEKIVVIDDTPEDTGKINPVSASFVFAFFGVLVVLILVGTNWFSYHLSISNAQNYFDKNKYTQAYNEVYGMDIKDEDIELYDKIRTVMYVNKQLNSYNNYYAMEKYPEALDSLLKGLSRYDKYIELATYLGIDSDLDYVRDKILLELKNVFHLSEKKALKIINSKTQTAYSIAIYDIVKENMTNIEKTK